MCQMLSLSFSLQQKTSAPDKPHSKDNTNGITHIFSAREGSIY